MKVKDIIEAMSDYDPNDELIIDWWDRSCFDHIWDDILDEQPLTKQDKQQRWSQIAESFRLTEYTVDSIVEDIWDALLNAQTEDEVA